MQASEAAELLNRIGLTNKTIPFLSRPFLVVSSLFFYPSLSLSFFYILECHSWQVEVLTVALLIP